MFPSHDLWGTTAGATWDITGFQLEVGPEATPFETRSYHDELRHCQRYYEQLTPNLLILGRYSHHDGNPYTQYRFLAQKRAAPTGSYSGTFTSSTGYAGNPTFSEAEVDSILINGANTVSAGGILYLDDSGSALIKFSAEL